MDTDGSSTVVLTVASGPWRDAIDALDPLALRVIQAALDAGAVSPWLRTGEVGLLLTDDREIRSLNAAYRKRDRATNVLSFPGLDLIEGRAEATAPQGSVLLGDVAISFERLSAEAAEQGKTLTDHFAHLLVHGTLHLLGYDHGDDASAAVMERLEDTILEALGFAAPYAMPSETDAMRSVAT